jgi:hypothetical protein
MHCRHWRRQLYAEVRGYTVIFCLWAGISWAYVTTSRAHGSVHGRKVFLPS